MSFLFSKFTGPQIRERARAGRDRIVVLGPIDVLERVTVERLSFAMAPGDIDVALWAAKHDEVVEWEGGPSVSLPAAARDPEGVVIDPGSARQTYLVVGVPAMGVGGEVHISGLKVRVRTKDGPRVIEVPVRIVVMWTDGMGLPLHVPSSGPLTVRSAPPS